jgi:hypothetical protein
MPTGKTCGNCKNFIRVRRSWFQQGGRNGLCDFYDYNCNSDSSYAKECPGYRKNPDTLAEKISKEKLDTYNGH